MSSSSRILKNPWLLVVFGLWSLLAISLVNPCTVHAAAIVPMEKTSPMDVGQPMSIVMRNDTNSLMKLTGSNLLGSKGGVLPADVKPHSRITFDSQGTSGWATWLLNSEPKTPTIKIRWSGSDPWNDSDLWSNTSKGGGSGIVSIPPNAVQFGTGMIMDNSTVQETFTIRPKHS